MRYRSIWTYLSTTAHRLGWVDAGGVRTRYLEAGDPQGPTVLVLHGTAGSLENFCANYGPLGERFRVIGIDMLGCGYTDKPDRPYLIRDYAAHAIAVMDALGVSRAAIIGVSLGSWVGARMALDHPDRVSSLTMVAPAGVIVDAEEEEAFRRDVRRRREAAAAEPSWESVSRAMANLMHDPDDLIDDLVATRLAIYQQPGMVSAMQHLLAFASPGQHIDSDEWERLEQPVLIIAAVDADNMFLQNARHLGGMIPNARVVELSRCDHWAQFERSDSFNQIVEEFLASSSLVAPVEHA